MLTKKRSVAWKRKCEKKKSEIMTSSRWQIAVEEKYNKKHSKRK